jgi:hypothetical protein
MDCQRLISYACGLRGQTCLWISAVKQYLIFLIVGSFLAPLAALSAYLITYDEYQHHYPDKKRVRRAALQAAGVAFIFFITLSAALGFFLDLLSAA